MGRKGTRASSTQAAAGKANLRKAQVAHVGTHRPKLPKVAKP